MEVPRELLEHCGGFSLHKGSSSIELVYVPKETTDAERKTSEFKLDLATFTESQLDEVVKHLKQHASFPPTSVEVPQINVTGFSNICVVQKLEKELGISLCNCPRWQCFARGLAYLGRNTEDAFTYLEQGSIDHTPQIKSMTTNYEIMSGGCKNKMVGHVDVVEALGKLNLEEIYAKSPLVQMASGAGVSGFPCLLVLYGSRTTFLKVHENGEYDLLDVDGIGTASFTGLGRLLSGSDTIESLIQLVSVGDAKQVDFGKFDILGMLKDSGDSYSSILKADIADDVIFFFGKTSSKTTDDFKKEDLVRALLQSNANDLASLTIRVAVSNGLKDVIYSGSMFKNQLVKDMFAAWFLRHNMFITTFTGEAADLNLHYLRHGSHVAALGAMVTNLKDWSKTSVLEQPT